MLRLLKTLKEDLDCIFDRDPAAKTVLEVLLCYPGLHAIWTHRINHWLWVHGVTLTARMLSQWSRFWTGIEIHPGAQIGQRFFIDHGMGVVIGETTVIGDDVTLFQGATLGGTGKEKGKRHPTLKNGVYIGAGAKVLGNLVIGENVRVGAGSVVLRDVPDNSTIVGVPGHIILRNGKRVVIMDPKEVNDPLSDVIAALAKQVHDLKQKVKDLSHDESLDDKNDLLCLKAMAGLSDDEDLPS